MNNEEIVELEKIKKCVTKRKINWTKHCLNRMNQRDILVSDIKLAIENGNIIEHYYKDYPYPSCLICGKDSNKKNIHIVCGISEDEVYMITAYHPDRNEWENGMKDRRN